MDQLPKYNLNDKQYSWLTDVWCNLSDATTEYHLIKDIILRGYYNDDEKQFLNSHRISLNKEIK